MLNLVRASINATHLSDIIIISIANIDDIANKIKL